MDLKLCEKTVHRIWNKEAPVWSFEEDAVRIGDDRVPLMFWRFDRRLTEMRGLVGQSVCQLCAYKSVRVDHAGEDFDAILLREIDVCQWLLGQDIVSVYAISSGDKALLALAETASGIVCAIDLAATLSPESKVITRHEITGVEGLITDRAINEQIPIDALYLFQKDRKHPETFTDMDYSMLGLNPEEIQVVDFVIDLLADPTQYGELQSRYERLKKLVGVVRKSIETGEKVFVEEVEG